MHKNCVLRPDRLRRVPARFSWIDHRLIRDGYVNDCGVVDLALYLVLVTVADRNGVSFYADRTLCRMLHILPGELAASRHRLVRAGLLEFSAPFYQVLSLDEPVSAEGKEQPEAATAEQIEAAVRGFLGRANG